MQVITARPKNAWPQAWISGYVPALLYSTPTKTSESNLPNVFLYPKGGECIVLVKEYIQRKESWSRSGFRALDYYAAICTNIIHNTLNCNWVSICDIDDNNS